MKKGADSAETSDMPLFVNKRGNVCTNLTKWRGYEAWSYFTSINESIFNKEATVDLSKPIAEQ